MLQNFPKIARTCHDVFFGLFVRLMLKLYNQHGVAVQISCVLNISVKNPQSLVVYFRSIQKIYIIKLRTSAGFESGLSE